MCYRESGKFFSFNSFGNQFPESAVFWLTLFEAVYYTFKQFVYYLNFFVLHFLHSNIYSLQEEARLAVRKGDRKSALNILRRKKRAEKDLHDKDIQCQRLLSMLEQLVQTKQTRDIIDIYKTSTQAFKASLARQGLTVENVGNSLLTHKRIFFQNRFWGHP